MVLVILQIGSVQALEDLTEFARNTSDCEIIGVDISQNYHVVALQKPSNNEGEDPLDTINIGHVNKKVIIGHLIASLIAKTELQISTENDHQLLLDPERAVAFFGFSMPHRFTKPCDIRAFSLKLENEKNYLTNDNRKTRIPEQCKKAKLVQIKRINKWCSRQF